MNRLHEDMVNMGNRILSLSRSELYLSMRYLDLALSSLTYQLNLKTRTIATDGVHLFYHTAYLAKNYQADPVWINRAYLHLILHGIFHHITGCEERNMDDWNLACDIAVESIIDSMDYDCIHMLVGDQKQHYYDSFDLPVMNAEQIYAKLQTIPELTKRQMRAEFTVDDHQFWDKLQDDKGKQQKPSPGNDPEEDPPPPDKNDVEQKWNDISQKTQVSMETFRKEDELEAGELIKQLRIEHRQRMDYRTFLEKFSVYREEISIDPDSFDYAFYTYGLALYGNIPLIEELEYREVKKIHDFVIAVDTSGSCTQELLEKFLEETASILFESGSFFREVNIHIIQCDAAIQSDIKIRNIDDFKQMAKNFTTHGDGDTDFRPVFDYVDQLIAQQEITRLQGLIFFTDGIGVYPKKRPTYDTAFVFFDDSYAEHLVPPWAMKLCIGTQDIKPATK